jgi:hypothetical protein
VLSCMALSVENERPGPTSPFFIWRAHSLTFLAQTGNGPALSGCIDKTQRDKIIAELITPAVDKLNTEGTH